jgi:hypothetical protein
MSQYSATDAPRGTRHPRYFAGKVYVFFRHLNSSLKFNDLKIQLACLSNIFGFLILGRMIDYISNQAL